MSLLLELIKIISNYFQNEEDNDGYIRDEIASTSRVEEFYFIIGSDNSLVQVSS
uniref:Uncharacterized protein n=1 Tax=Rhizophagus irregularis (strain DAOM 181602 / DAOM 197198 / MUCL 43194) TaxID=747089 RepID=U9TK78_RHIID